MKILVVLSFWLAECSPVDQTRRLDRALWASFTISVPSPENIVSYLNSIYNGTSTDGRTTHPPPAAQADQLGLLILRGGAQRWQSGGADPIHQTRVQHQHQHGVHRVCYVHMANRADPSRYGTTFCGWLFAALTNSILSQYFNLGALLVLGATLQILAHALRPWLPPFPLFALTFFFAALGQAYQDTHANNFVATVQGAHRWLGFIHAMYMGGCLVGPFLSTAIASAGDVSRWELFYTTPLGAGVVNLTLVVVAFREWIALKQRQDEMPSTSRQRDATVEMKRTLSTPGVWLLSLYFFFFLGAVITAGGVSPSLSICTNVRGWIVEYLVRVRNGDLDQMGYVPAGFYGGAFVGRLILAEPTYRFGERRMICVYVALCLALELVFWLYLSQPLT